MTPEIAKFHFHGEEDYNCAQAVLKAFQVRYKLTQTEIDAHQISGGGRVAGGTCGALYAAQLLAGEAHQQEIEQHFVNRAQHRNCESIKDKTLSCRDCVATATEALVKIHEKPR